MQLKVGAAWRSYDKQIFSYHRSPQWNLGVPVNLACEPSGDWEENMHGIKTLPGKPVCRCGLSLLVANCLLGTKPLRFEEDRSFAGMSSDIAPNTKRADLFCI